MFEQFTDRARRAMALASQEAQRLGHDHIGTEHLLLGIVKEASGVAAIVLAQFNVDLSTVRQKVEQMVHGPSSGHPPRRLRQTERYTRVLGYAMDEAMSLSNHYVGTEHLLLGLLREPEGTAARVLASLHLKLEDVRKAVLDVLGRAPARKGVLLDQAMNDIRPRLGDISVEPDKVRQILEALINAGWRPQQ